jgi:4-hydroxy-3-methylbut-2-enyl diphosphate reductase
MKQFDVPSVYRSSLISVIKEMRRQKDKLKKDFAPTHLNLGDLQIYLARHFGFCYGVENAIEIAFKTLKEQKGKRIFLLSEMIHNPQVNEHLKQQGIQFLQDTMGNQKISFNTLHSDDVVIIPAFGTTLEIEQLLKEKNIQTETYNTTCPFVEKVWNRSTQIAQKGYSIVVHGKPNHEETRATFSHASFYTATVIIKDMSEAIALGKYITEETPAGQFYNEFKGRYSKGFDVKKHLQRIGVVNQTTQLAADTQAIADYLKQIMVNHYGLNASNLQERFADTRDTLCYATNDNQSSVIEMLKTPADLAIVVGGYNSSNTSHLVELCEEKLPTYFIHSADKILSAHEILHCEPKTKQEHITTHFLPNHRPVKILITSGASCPDSVVESVLQKLASIYKAEDKLNEYAMQLV